MRAGSPPSAGWCWSRRPSRSMPSPWPDSSRKNAARFYCRCRERRAPPVPRPAKQKDRGPNAATAKTIPARPENWRRLVTSCRSAQSEITGDENDHDNDADNRENVHRDTPAGLRSVNGKAGREGRTGTGGMGCCSPSTQKARASSVFSADASFGSCIRRNARNFERAISSESARSARNMR